MIIDTIVYWYPKHSKLGQNLRIGDLTIGVVYKDNKTKKIIAKSYMTNIVPHIGEFESMRKAKRRLVKAFNVWAGTMQDLPYNKPFINNEKIDTTGFN